MPLPAAAPPTHPPAPQVGVEIIQRAIRRPAKTIANNAGLEGDVIVGKLLEREGDENVGFNAAAGRFEDMVKAGVIDPMKVGGWGLAGGAGMARGSAAQQGSGGAALCSQMGQPMCEWSHVLLGGHWAGCSQALLWQGWAGVEALPAR